MDLRYVTSLAAVVIQIAFLVRAITAVKKRPQATQRATSAAAQAKQHPDVPPNHPPPLQQPRLVRATQHQSRLLSLPAELPRIIWLKEIIAADPESALTRPSIPIFALACHQIFVEAVPIFLYEIRFVFDASSDKRSEAAAKVAHTLYRWSFLLSGFDGQPVRLGPWGKRYLVREDVVGRVCA